jgi:hypothetical protein
VGSLTQDEGELVSVPKFKVGWFYVMTEEAKPIFAAVFKQGVVPGAAIIVSEEDFEILREGIMPLPVAVLDEQGRIITAEAT